MVKYDNKCIDRLLCDKSTNIGTPDCYHIENRLIKYSLSIQDGRQKSKMAATKLIFFDISTSDCGDFPQITEIALFIIYSFTKPKLHDKC